MFTTDQEHFEVVNVHPFHMDAVERVEAKLNSVQTASYLVCSHGVTKSSRTRVKFPSRTLVKSSVRPVYKRVGSELKIAELVGRTWSDDKIKALVILNGNSTRFTQFR